MARKLVDDKELNEIYPHFTVWTINELRRKNQIPYLKFPGIRRYLFDLEAIERWMDSLQGNNLSEVVRK